MNNPFGNQNDQEQAPYAPVPDGQRTSKRKNPFERTAAADPNQSSVYPVPGIYPVLMIDALKMIESRNNEDLFIAELEILDSQVEDRPAGTRMSWIVNFKHDSAPGNVKAFFCNAFGIPEEEVTAESMQYCCSAKNPARGRLVRLEATNVKTKRNTDFTKCKWLFVPDNMQGQCNELRKNAGFDGDIPF